MWGLSQTLECQVNGFFVSTAERGEADPCTPLAPFANVSTQLWPRALDGRLSAISVTDCTAIPSTWTPKTPVPQGLRPDRPET